MPGVAPRYGGPSTAIWPMVAALNRVPGVTAELVATDADGPGGRVTAEQLPATVPARLFPRTRSEQWKYSPALGRWVRERARDYDLVHIHSLWSYSTAAAARAAARSGVPYVLRPAGMLSEYCLAVRGFKKRVYWAAVEGRTVRRAAGFHCTGADEVRDVLAVRPGATTYLIPQGIEEAAFAAPIDPGALRRRCGPAAGGRPIVLFLGRLHPVKGVADLLLPAFARVAADAYLAVAGGQDAQAPGHPTEVRAEIDRLGLGGRVGLLGPVAAADRWQLFDGAAAFVLPSHSENFGMVVAEAMARGCPVVVTEGVQAKAQVLASGAGRVVRRDPSELAAVLTDLLTHPDLRDALGAAGRDYARARMSWDTVAAQLAAMYAELTARHPRPAAT